jgi:DNA-directed RNA polymerase specialized sigma24 family protein
MRSMMRSPGLDLTRQLGRLSRRDRELLIGKYYIGLSQEDLGRLCGMKRGTVAAAISRAATRLRAVRHG